MKIRSKSTKKIHKTGYKDSGHYHHLIHHSKCLISCSILKNHASGLIEEKLPSKLELETFNRALSESALEEPFEILNSHLKIKSPRPFYRFASLCQSNSMTSVTDDEVDKFIDDCIARYKTRKFLDSDPLALYATDVSVLDYVSDYDNDWSSDEKENMPNCKTGLRDHMLY